MVKTKLGPISPKEEMLSGGRHVHQSPCACVFMHVPALFTLLCRWLWGSVCVRDWHVVDLSGAAFSLIRRLCTADDWQLICGPEISVLEKEVSLKRATSKQNWSQLVPFLWQNMCVRLVMRTGQTFLHGACHHPSCIYFQHKVTAAFWTCQRTDTNSIKTFALVLLKTTNKSRFDWCADQSCVFD